IPSTGLELLVVNDTAAKADTDDEVIATFRPTRDQLETTAGAAPPTLLLDDHNGGVEKLEVMVSRVTHSVVTRVVDMQAVEGMKTRHGLDRALHRHEARRRSEERRVGKERRTRVGE